MKLKNKIKFLNDCLLVGDVLVIGDMHLGYEEQFQKAIFPGLHKKQIIKKIEGVFDYLEKKKINIREIVILGDLKHDFGNISNREWREVLEFLDYLKNKTYKITVIKGNHDKVLIPILRKRDIELRDFYIREGVCFLHGDGLFEQCLNRQTDVLVFGHLHPAIIIADKYKSEKFKCFLKGRWKSKTVYVLPSFTPVSYGFDLLDIDETNKNKKEHFIIENKELKNFEVIIYNNKDKKEYNFGKLRELID
ncbi:hypothetical protein GF386_01440 [Candidatus Pacearchaeota archaeon]|nr:hypothetical protein [Candidatus Pacearchaeota archaeon]MBD3282846.1 hypothetical protein [Candidatus Pacearchaeota archaeon]